MGQYQKHRPLRFYLCMIFMRFYGPQALMDTNVNQAAFIATVLLPDQSREAGTKYRVVTLPTDSKPPLSRTNNLNP